MGGGEKYNTSNLQLHYQINLQKESEMSAWVKVMWNKLRYCEKEEKNYDVSLNLSSSKVVSVVMTVVMIMMEMMAGVKVIMSVVVMMVLVVAVIVVAVIVVMLVEAMVVAVVVVVLTAVWQWLWWFNGNDEHGCGTGINERVVTLDGELDRSVDIYVAGSCVVVVVIVMKVF